MNEAHCSLHNGGKYILQCVDSLFHNCQKIHIWGYNGHFNSLTIKMLFYVIGRLPVGNSF